MLRVDDIKCRSLEVFDYSRENLSGFEGIDEYILALPE
jgi:hypothetical protein